MGLREYRELFGLTQAEVVDEVCRLALARGDAVVPGLDQPALSKHENGQKRPRPYYQALYCEVYGATPAELGFRVALPCETEDVDRREFLAGAAGFVASAALPALAEPTRLGQTDVKRLRGAIDALYRLDDLHGSGVVYALSKRNFQRLRGLVERADYSATTGQALRELAGLAAEHAGWSAFDADRHDDARGWWLEAMHWAHLADAESVNVVATASMAKQASERRRPREAIDLAQAAQRTAGRAATPRLTSVLLAREAMGHAGMGDAAGARNALRRARAHVETRRDDDPRWLAFYGPADFASHEHRVALMLGDLAAAEDGARTALSLSDPVTYPRDNALDLTNLADVLAQRRKIDESAAVAAQAAVAAADVESARVTRRLRDVAKRLEPYRDNAEVGAFLAMV